MGLQGYGPLLLSGARITVSLALVSLLMALLLGVAGALAKTSGVRVVSSAARAYTTLVRGIPDLVLVLLLFYSLQQGLNSVTEHWGFARLEIDPFAAASLTLAVIYGAYFTEVFRGAFIAVPAGQMEAARSYGLSPAQAFRRILFPQMLRFALPGIANTWQVLLKSTGLISVVGLIDMVAVAQQAGKATNQYFLFTAVVGAGFLLLGTGSSLLLKWLDIKYSAGCRRGQF